MTELDEFVDRTFKLRENIGESKVTSLSQAVQQHIRPGMTLHLSTSAEPNAAIREIIRQYWGQDPRFTLVSGGVTTPYPISLAVTGMATQVVSTNLSYTYPTPRPIPLLQKAVKQGNIAIENWSLNALEQRLMAAALGVGFMPTKSLVGTDTATENPDSFKMVPDPFDAAKSIGTVRALAPDVAIVHGCVADRYGNTILPVPYFAGLWGPRASRKVIVTVEKIVSTDFIRDHAALVKVPGYLVTAVCEVPMGAHPQGLTIPNIPGVNAYAEDHDFLVDYVKVSRDVATLNAWLKEWVLDCPAQDDYLNKLGPARTFYLKGKVGRDAWRFELKSARRGDPADPAYNSTEMMVVAGAREIKKKVREAGYKAMLAGIGTSGLAAWLAFYLLQDEGYHIDLMTGSGQLGYAPRPADPALLSMQNVMTCVLLTDTTEAYGVYVGGAYNRCLSVLGAAQVDKYGNINSSRIGDLFLIGSGGAGDAINARETILVAKQAKERFMDRVPYVTCPGTNVRTMVTNFGVFEKRDGDEFTLARLYASPNLPTTEARIQEVRANCGWPLKVAEHPEEVSPPTRPELLILRSLDSERLFISER